ncbi:ribonucleoside-triphosphate reductase class III catalytic subunit [Thermanaeromonas toyohensis ToBE]|uniref:Ribonucleoside-triphosphate reductase class III catalytic subunit n=1 Tax=Thermanaeromonas toyohensis ToBE TaxID=698762 RepID=A0A1W1VT63_9FIRM|nr:ribonucleoside triphosphate reductase [Thermanaeromonas toyohensis]SMB96420.1 ribonucleoside-triphosphate reductase class III catalytic subunit [Thermanaeromonas toyohensis ToBE]
MKQGDCLQGQGLPEKIVKRDGRVVPFDAMKITAAVQKAFNATGTDGDAWEVTRRVIDQLVQGSSGVPSVEQVQDLVETALMELGYYHAAKAYILYREQRRRIREMKSLVSQDLIDQYLEEADWRVRENANIGYSLQGLNNYLVGSLAAEYWLERIYPPEVREAHRNGDFHIHDLNLMAPYCMGWDLAMLLQEGFNGVPAHAEARPPKHLRSALGQLYNFLYTCQGEAAGAQAVSNFDTLMAPYVRADSLSYQQVRQAVQEFIFNLNVPTRVGFQPPFTNVTLDGGVPEFMKAEPAVVGGREMPFTYGDLEEERAMVARAFCEVLLEGDASGKGFTFPVPTVNVTPEFWSRPEVDIIFEVTAKYGSFYFGNFINSDLRPEDVRSLCCRLRLDNRELRKRGGGLFGANPLTGSIGVVTLNLPRLAYQAEDEDDFFSRLARLASVAVTALELKRKALEKFADMGLYPFAARYLAGVKKRFGKLFANHFSTIGVVGGNEMCLNLLGVGIGHPEGRAFALKVLDFLREFCLGAQERTGNLYNLEATPAEGCSYRLARIDKMKWPDIVVANEPAWKKGAEPYYTNSTLLPVDATDDPVEYLEHQEELQCAYTGGTVVHIWLGEERPDPGACAEFVKKVFTQYRIPYLTLTPVYSVCPSHGYRFGKHEVCPDCGDPCEVFSRVVGYYRPVSRWNAGKQEEFRDRKMFRLGA